MKTNAGSRSGFTLLEVVLAVLILGLSLTVFYAAANEGLAVAMQARDYQISRQMLGQLPFREPLDLEEVEAGETKGSFTHPEYGRVNWSRTIEIEGEEEDRFFRITTNVSRGDGFGGLSESVESFLYQPSAIRGGWIQEPFDDF